jgi:phosphoglycerate dehydrogenase-like enzyme
MELTRTLPKPMVADPVRLDAGHIVFVLSPREAGLFFASEPRLNAPGMKESWVNVEKWPAAAWEEALRRLRPTVLVTAWSCPALPLDWGLEEDCPLRYVCSITGSVKPRVPRELIERGLLVTNWGARVSDTVAEHAMLMVLALLRGLPGWPDLMVRPRSMFEMMPVLRSRPLRGRRVGLHGFGAVARGLIGMLRPYDVEIAAYSEGVPRRLFDEFGVRECRSLRELFSRSEVLVECEGLNDSSRGSVSEEILRLLPDDAVFVNVGRGAVVDEAALARIAGEGRLRVGLDVFQREPLAPDSPLFGNPRVLLSPHVAGPTWETYPDCGEQALERLACYLRGETPENRVTLEIYDRAT